MLIPNGRLMGSYHAIGLSLLELQGLHSLKLLLKRIIFLLERLGGPFELPLDPLVRPTIRILLLIQQ